MKRIDTPEMARIRRDDNERQAREAVESLWWKEFVQAAPGRFLNQSICAHRSIGGDAAAGEQMQAFATFRAVKRLTR
jgi:hypothetical protein